MLTVLRQASPCFTLAASGINGLTMLASARGAE
jgi:hypothetical protein